MTIPELIQQQRHILHTLHNAVRQYQQQIAQAKEHLEIMLKQIQADRAAAEQEAKREYEQARDSYEEEQVGVQLLSEIEEKTDRVEYGIVSSALDISTCKEQIQGIGKARKKSLKTLRLLVLASEKLWGISSALAVLGLFLLFITDNLGDIVGCSLIFLPFVLIIATLVNKAVVDKNAANDLRRLSSLHQHWLKIISQQAQMQNAKAQKTYEQALEQTEQQLSDSVQQLRPAALNYTTLVDQTSPPWQSEAWQNWRPSTLTPGVVRLGVFTLQPDQLAVKSTTISQAKHPVPGTVLNATVVKAGTAVSR